MTVFLRRIYNRYHKLGKKKGKNRVWRKPKGRDNKMREKRRGYAPVVSVGYRKKQSEIEKIPVIRNASDLAKITRGQKIILGKLGKKKKLELVKKAEEMGVLIVNINSKKFLKIENIKNKGEIKKWT